MRWDALSVHPSSAVRFPPIVRGPEPGLMHAVGVAKATYQLARAAAELPRRCGPAVTRLAADWVS